MNGKPLSCWVISDGRRGIETQALGLAEAAGRLRPLSIGNHAINTSAALKPMPPHMQFKLKSRPEDYGLNAPYPALAIGCGRQAMAPLLALKKVAGERVFTAYIQDPRMETNAFDLVIAPEHDGLTGVNVETMIGSPNRVTEATIVGHTLEFGNKLATLPMPRAAFLIGGKSQTHALGKREHQFHLDTAKAVHELGKSLLITTSRRTPDWAITDYEYLASDLDNVWLHTSGAPNPYFAFLGGAEQIFVTEDSTNMLTEACSTGKPVFRLPMAGKPGKFQKLYDALETRCHVTPVGGTISKDDYEPLDETARIAEKLWAHFDMRTALMN